MDFLIPDLGDGGYGYAIFMFALIFVAAWFTVYALRKSTQKTEKQERIKRELEIKKEHQQQIKKEQERIDEITQKEQRNQS